MIRGSEKVPCKARVNKHVVGESYSKNKQTKSHF